VKKLTIVGERLLLALDYLEFLSHCCSSAGRQGDPRTIRGLKPRDNPRGFSTDPQRVVDVLARGFGITLEPIGRSAWTPRNAAFQNRELCRDVPEHMTLVHLSLYYRSERGHVWPTYQRHLRDNSPALAQVGLDVAGLLGTARTEDDLRCIDRDGRPGEFAFERFLRRLSVGEIAERDLMDRAG